MKQASGAILYVDDEEHNLLAFKAAFRRDFEVHTAISGEQALDILRTVDIQVVIVDQRMPIMTGVQFLERMAPEYPFIVRIILTGYSDTPSVIQAINKGGVYRYLTKPWDQIELRMALEQALNHYRLLETNRSLLLQLKEKVEAQSSWNEILEQKVQERTHSLEEANLRLQSSIFEKAEALSQVSVLEERNRIAQEIHDAVGHSLSISIVHIEACKKLLDRDRALALEKLEVSKKLVRQGLNQIRESVRMLKHSNPLFELSSAIDTVIQQTMQHTDIHIERTLGPLPEVSIEVQKLMFHALQEGLTNGIRHGDSTRFHFTLVEDGQWIRFELANNGHPYKSESYGFGLSAMKERVLSLGGTMEVSSNPNFGCIICIQVPIT